ncbi:MAG: 1-acyl-sn-glycerol-3-phosphate acyltransferase [Deltaproteobacteria bacterium]|nr:1-acyl-sn-glycerol-3-phosphate acyltransferase [Deltaproteobacteria bacterium]
MGYWIGRLWLAFWGWRIEGAEQLPAKFVFIASPHTSNWDVPFMLAAAYVLRIRISWLGKHSLFKGRCGRILRALGGIPVNRQAPQNLVQQIAASFHASTNLILAVPPEGTRRKTEYWKSGFYHIARTAGVPIGLGFLDYGRKRCGFGGFFFPSGDVRADMDRLRAFYGGIRGKYPEKTGRPRLREEDTPVGGVNLPSEPK